MVRFLLSFESYLIDVVWDGTTTHEFGSHSHIQISEEQDSIEDYREVPMVELNLRGRHEESGFNLAGEVIHDMIRL